MSREQVVKRGLYFSIIDGSFRTRVPQDHPECQPREWTSTDGKTTKMIYERKVDYLFGFIKDIQFNDGEFGMNINVTLDENEDGQSPIISVGTATREGEDLMKKLPNLDLSKEVRFRPFNFTGSENEEVRGMELMQQDENGEFKVKITNFFSSKEKQNDGSYKYSYLNGFPAPEGDTDSYSKDDWKIYFLTARKFLINYTKNEVAPRIGVADQVQTAPKRPLGEDPSADIDDALNAAQPDSELPF